MNKLKILLFKGLRKGLPGNKFKPDYRYVEKAGQEANDAIRVFLQTGKPCLVAKFGTVEMNMLLSLYNEHNGISPKVYLEALQRKNCIYPETQIGHFCNSTGFFPKSLPLARQFYERMMQDITEVDFLGSYMAAEKYFSNRMNCTRIDLEGYCAPFKWDNPWSSVLKDKKVLVVHPFAQTIERQYHEKREQIFENPDVLPHFAKLTCIKAVQSIAGEKTEFKDWFEALHHMEHQIEEADFDIALIGCGSYGFCLSAFVKRLGKQAIHLAGWTQMLFGIYGRRWVEDQPEFASFINPSWVRPTKEETPQNAATVEGGCYW